MHLALRKFENSILGQHVLILMDNMPAKAHINHQGGIRSRTLMQEAQSLGLDSFLQLVLRQEH